MSEVKKRDPRLDEINAAFRQMADEIRPVLADLISKFEALDVSVQNKIKAIAEERRQANEVQP